MTWSFVRIEARWLRFQIGRCIQGDQTGVNRFVIFILCHAWYLSFGLPVHVCSRRVRFRFFFSTKLSGRLRNYVPEMTYFVSSGTLNCNRIYSVCRWKERTGKPSLEVAPTTLVEISPGDFYLWPWPSNLTYMWCQIFSVPDIITIKTTSVSVTVTVTEAVSVTGWPMHWKQTWIGNCK